MKLNQAMFAASFFVLSSIAAAQTASSDIDKVINSLTGALEGGTIDDQTKLKLYGALEAARSAKARMEKNNAEMAKAQDGAVEQKIAELRALQRVLGGYLGQQEFNGAYRFRREPVQVEIEAGGVYDVLSKKLPFLRGAVGGKVRIDPGAQAVSQFNAVKAEFLGALVDAKNYDPNNRRLMATVKSLAEWGGKTSVLYPEQRGFGESIISFRDQSQFTFMKVPGEQQ